MRISTQCLMGTEAARYVCVCVFLILIELSACVLLRDTCVILKNTGFSSCVQIKVAEYVAQKFMPAFASKLTADENRDPLEILKETFLTLNDEMAPHLWARNCGTTAAVVLMQQNVSFSYPG